MESRARPGNCYFRLDKEAGKLILENLKARLQANRLRMAAELKALAVQLDRTPTLSEYVSETRYELADLYKPPIGGWLALLVEAGLESLKPQESDLLLLKRFQLLLHIDSISRLRFYLQAIRESEATVSSWPQSQRRMVEMLTFRLLQTEARNEATEWNTGLMRIQQSSTASRSKFLSRENVSDSRTLSMTWAGFS